MQLKEAVEGFLSGYFSTCRRSQKTRAAYRVDLNQVQNRLGGDTSIHSLDPECIERWANEMRTAGYAAVSVRRKFATLRVFFAYWMRKGLLNASPLSRIRLDLGRGRLLPRCLAVSDTKLLIEQAWQHLSVDSARPRSTHDRRFLAIRDIAVVEILFATGIRVGELVSLDLDDWCKDDSAFIVMGKGLRQRLAVMPDERSQKAIAMYLRARQELDLAHGALLVNANGRRISSQGIARILTCLAREAGLKIRITPHMIRHTVATLLLRCGADIRIVQEVLGHASISTTQRYTYVSKEHLLSTLHARHPNLTLGVKVPMQAGFP